MSVLELAVIPGVRLHEAPVLLLLHFHNALRQELADLRRTAAEALDNRIYGPDLIQELRRRFEFLKLVNKYHSVAEDEVIFRALDEHVKNVVNAYSLEHISTNDILDSIFHYLDVLKKEDEANISKPFQELVYFIGTLQTSICKHMAKEEEQVFPLLTRQFSTQEQASFVWQFMCSVPMLLLEDFFRWMNSFLSSDQREFVLQCLKEVVPKDLLLQEVVISCLETTDQTIIGDFDKYGKGSLFLNGRANFWNILEVYKSEGHCGEAMKPDNEYPLHSTAQYNPLDGAHLWHNAYHKDMLEVLEELYEIQDSNDFSGLVPAIIQLKFFADVIIFYSNALDKLFYSMCIELAEDCPAPSYQRFLDDSQIEGLQLLLYSKSENVMSARNFVEILCEKLKICATGIRKYLTFVEIEVFPFIIMNCSHEMQRWLLYASLEMMPLGLLKCTITWFSSHLSEDESKSILSSIKQGGLLVNKSLSSLLYEWVRIGYSGKTSVEKFRTELRAAFKNRCSFLPEQIKTNSSFPYVQMDTQVINKKGVSSSSSAFNSSSLYNTSYSSGINFHVFFPQKLKTLDHFTTYPTENNPESSFRFLESKPVDHIFFFHKALKTDMQHLVSLSANLADNDDLFTEFYRRFHLLRVLHKIHSDTEDEIAFPVLEAKEIIQNSSHSYSIDHKMDIEYFNRMSYVLDQISELYVDALGGRMVTYRQLCLKLHDMCKCMNKMLSDHVNHEEIELWPLFREHLSLKEQENIIGSMLGRTRAETLQEMLPWIMASLTDEEQNALMALWRKATKNTMFDQWLGEWWEGTKMYEVPTVEKSTVLTQSTADMLEIVSKYLPKDMISQKMMQRKTSNDNEREKSKDQMNLEPEEDFKVCIEISTDVNSGLVLSQEEIEATIRRVNCDQTLEPQKKTVIIQNLLMSRWINTQKKVAVHTAQDVSGIFLTYRDPHKLVFGCEHYKRNCKLVASCCNKLYTCRRCHDEKNDHIMDRKATTMMMCMKCLIIQPVGPTCSTVTCNNLSMARYYCSVCKLFDDERLIYHCPYCNLCRVGKGLGVDIFHCMNCNACMLKSSLSVHICRENCLEDNCPICHEYIFTSINPVKALACGHVMHSSCFREYTSSNYTCPICSKSLGDMQVYFRMLDAMLAEEKISEEYSGKTQDILCNDCEKKGSASFHWLYHKCRSCGSYNTRVI